MAEKSKYVQGQLLLDSGQLQGFFQRTVLLVCQHHADGAFGLVLNRNTGKKVGEISLPERPANLAFGDADRQTLYICARTSLYRVRVAIAGR